MWYTIIYMYNMQHETNHCSFVHRWPAGSQGSNYTEMNQQCCCTHAHMDWETDTHCHLQQR